MLYLKSHLKVEEIILIVLPLLLILSMSINAKAEPLPTPALHGGRGHDYGYSVIQTTDGGYAFAGYTVSSGAGGMDFLLVKTDAVGNPLWSVTYGGEGDEIAYSVIQTSTGDYLVVGTTTSWTRGGEDCLLVKVDETGKVVEPHKTYGGVGVDVIYEIIEDVDFYVLVGRTSSDTAGGNDFWFLKLDSVFNVKLEKRYGGIENDVAESVVAIGGGNYVIAGYWAPASTSYVDKGNLWCIHVDSSGNKITELEFGGPREDVGRSIIKTRDGGYAIAGYSERGNGNYDFWLVKTSSSLNVEYEQFFGELTQEERAWSLVQTTNGDYVLAGYAHSDSQKNDVMLVKTKSDSESGIRDWIRMYDGSGDEGAESIILPKDNQGIVVAGYTNSYGKGNDFLLLKTWSNGDVQWSATYGEVNSNPGPIPPVVFIIAGVSISLFVIFGFRTKIIDIIGGLTHAKTKILFIASTKPLGDEKPLPVVDAYKTIKEIVNNPKNKSHFDLIDEINISRDKIQSVLTDLSPDIVHFFGHGKKDCLYIQNENGILEPTLLKPLVTIFKEINEEQHRKGRNTIKIVVLVACNSDEIANEISKHVDCGAIGVFNETAIKSGEAFSKEFYSHLCKHESLGYSFRLASNMQEFLNLNEEDKPKIFPKDRNFDEFTFGPFKRNK